MTVQRAIRAVPRRVCKNAGSDRAHGARLAPHPGPRCHTCWRENRKQRAAASREKRLNRGFAITQEEYARVKECQGGMCICGPWTGYNGNTRPLSVDHDHKTGLVRGLLCKHCNDLLGRVKDDPQYFERMRSYLQFPPAQTVLGPRYVPEG